jgi:hypothetical protein
MSNEAMDDGVIMALLDRFNKQRLPRLLELKERVGRGEKLNELDIAHMEEGLSSSNRASPDLLERHPEYKPLIAQVIALYKEIMDKALENEQKS